MIDMVAPPNICISVTGEHWRMLTWPDCRTQGVDAQLLGLLSK
jgi:hypothetical protein